MKTRLLLAALVGSALLLGQSLVRADKAPDSKAAETKFEGKCPVSGKPCKEESSVDYHGKKVYFCCDNCPTAFKADPKKFAAKAAVQLLGTKQITQVACPFTGKPINPEAKVDVGGVSVGFCCMNCKGKASKADDKVALVFGDIAKGFTLQTTCPVSGKAIDATKVVKHDGKNVYFCCGNCPGAFEKDPSKFTAKLPQFSEKK